MPLEKQNKRQTEKRKKTKEREGKERERETRDYTAEGKKDEEMQSSTGEIPVQDIWKGDD